MANYWTPKRIFSGRAPAPEEVVYTADGNVILKEVVVVNTNTEPRGDGSSVDVGLSVLGSSGEPGPDNRLLPDVTVAAGETITITLSTALDDGDRISLRASAPDRATVHVTAVERIPA